MSSDTNTKICAHLQPFLSELIRQGSSITAADESAWSNCLLNVILDKGPDPRAGGKNLRPSRPNKALGKHGHALRARKRLILRRMQTQPFVGEITENRHDIPKGQESNDAAAYN